MIRSDRFDSDGMLIAVAAALGALFVALAIVGVFGDTFDDTKQRSELPPPAAVYSHPEPVAP